MSMARKAGSEAAATNTERLPPRVIELRRYRLYPGARETLIDLFDRELVEPQEALGMNVLGQFRDLDDAHCFVWLRGFADMEQRAKALARFYGGPVWAAHRDEANATMINSDDVLLLRPSLGSGLTLASRTRADIEAEGTSSGLILSTVCHVRPNGEGELAEFFEAEMRPRLKAAGATVLATLVTERSANTFPRLPVRERESVFVWLSGFPDAASYAAHVGRLAKCRDWTGTVLPELARRTWRAPEEARLAPTARSLIR